MEPPVGFILLCEAVYLVGHRLYGPDWHPVGEVFSKQLFDPTGRRTDEIDTRRLFEPEPERVIRMIAEWCAAGEVAAGYRSVTGDVESLGRGVWQRPHWQHYFADGTIDLELPLLDEDWRPSADGCTARCTREIFVRRQDIDQFAEALKPQKSKAGRRAKHAWEAWKQLFDRERETRGDPRDPDQMPGWNSIAAAAETLLNLNKGGEVPDQKTLERHMSRWLRGT